jgi:hypothetical protein
MSMRQIEKRCGKAAKRTFDAGLIADRSRTLPWPYWVPTEPSRRVARRPGGRELLKSFMATFVVLLTMGWLPLLRALCSKRCLYLAEAYLENPQQGVHTLAHCSLVSTYSPFELRFLLLISFSSAGSSLLSPFGLCGGLPSPPGAGAVEESAMVMDGWVLDD